MGYYIYVYEEQEIACFFLFLVILIYIDIVTHVIVWICSSLSIGSTELCESP